CRYTCLTTCSQLQPLLIPLSLHDALPISGCAVGKRNEIDLDDPAHRGEGPGRHHRHRARDAGVILVPYIEAIGGILDIGEVYLRDRKSTRLNSSHQITSYAVFCLIKKHKL